jgi:hypothetical protein
MARHFVLVILAVSIAVLTASVVPAVLSVFCAGFGPHAVMIPTSITNTNNKETRGKN